MKNKNSQLDLAGTGYCASFNIRRTARTITSLYDAAMQRAGLGSASFTILVGIAKSEPVSIGVLAKTLAIDPTTMTRNLGRMEKRGLLAVSARSLKRQRFVTLLPAGRKALERCMPFWRQVQEQVVNKIGSDCWKQFQADLERLSAVAVELELSVRRARAKSRTVKAPLSAVGVPTDGKRAAPDSARLSSYPAAAMRS
jgi:DNA-binding MarR family transcriptional regulator